MAAKLMPEQLLLENLEKALREYMKTPTKEKKDALAMFSMLVTTRLDNDNTPEELIAEMKKLEQTKDLLNPSKF